MSQPLQPSDCPACGHGIATEIVDRPGIRREMELLWQFHLRRLRPGVPVAQLADRVVFTQAPPLRLARCGRCGTVFRDPRETPTAVDERYREESVEPEVLERLLDTQVAAERGRVGRLTRAAGGPGRGLEVGCYAGAFLTASAEAGWTFDGLDVNDRVLEHLHRRGLPARRGRVTELEPDAPYDAVVFWTCLDQHAAPRVAVRAAAALLAPGGVLAARVPNGAFYGALRDRLDGPVSGLPLRLLAWNNLLGFPYLQGFTTRSLRRLLLDAGLEVVLEVGDVLVPITDSWSRRWAVAEERAVKAALRPLPASASPWIEVYARRK